MQPKELQHFRSLKILRDSVFMDLSSYFHNQSGPVTVKVCDEKSLPARDLVKYRELPIEFFAHELFCSYCLPENVFRFSRMMPHLATETLRDVDQLRFPAKTHVAGEDLSVSSPQLSPSLSKGGGRGESSCRQA